MAQLSICSKCSLKYEKYCKPCKSVTDKIYRQKNKEKLAAYFKEKWLDPRRREANTLYKSIGYFGRPSLIIIKELGSKCTRCSLTDEQSREKWGQRLCIDHIDNQGRRVKTPNNDPSNLQLLCRSCHATKTFTEDYKVVGKLQKVALK